MQKVTLLVLLLFIIGVQTKVKFNLKETIKTNEKMKK